VAIILKVGRPSIQVCNGEFVTPVGWEDLDRHRTQIRTSIDAVGLLRVHGDPLLEWVGTAFLVGPGLVMTGGSGPATLLTAAFGIGPRFDEGKSLSVSFLNDAVDAPGIELKVTSAAFVHPCYDVALLKVEPPNQTSDRRSPPPRKPSSVGLEQMVKPTASQGVGASDEKVDAREPPQLPAPLTLAAAPPEPLFGRKVVVIGFPARDARNDPELTKKVFGDAFAVKAVQPGTLRGLAPLELPQHGNPGLSWDKLGALNLTHDCSTLGGNSGSPVVDLETGHVLGIHYAGRFLQENLAVPAWELARDPHVRRHGILFNNDPPWLSLWEELAWRSKSPEAEPLKSRMPPAPPRERSQILSADKLRDIHRLLIQAGFGDRDKVKTLFVGMNYQFVASLPGDGSPADRLILILDVLNRAAKLPDPDNELPFEAVLQNAVHTAMLRPELQELQRYLNEVRESAK
jgi:hypothetical protein